MQDALLALTKYWTDRGCIVVQPFNTEVGAGTLNPATVLRVRSIATAPIAIASRTTAAVTKIRRRENLRPNTRGSVSRAWTIYRKADTTISVMPGHSRHGNALIGKGTSALGTRKCS